MPFFTYKAINNITRRKVFGSIEAKDEENVYRALAEKDLLIISLKKKKSKNNKKGQSLMAVLNKVTAKELVVFSRQFSVMLKASVPVVKALRILTKQTNNPKMQAVLSSIAHDVDGGMQLSKALSQHPKIFSNFFVAMIKSGETSGRLDEVLEYLADQQEKDYDLLSKIKGAMIYPAFILTSLVVVGAVMMIFVIPKLTGILTETGGELPSSTKILIGTSDFMAHYWWLLLFVLVALIVGIKYFISTKEGKKYWDWLIIKLPIFGGLFRKIYLVRMSRSLATLSEGGIQLVNALQITSEVVSNQVYKNILEETIAEVQDGNSIASVFLQKKEIPTMVSYMVDVGEQTGKLDVVLNKLSDFYGREIDNMVANLVSLIEPLIMVVLGVAVGLMVAAIIMPMYNLASSF